MKLTAMMMMMMTESVMSNFPMVVLMKYVEECSGFLMTMMMMMMTMATMTMMTTMMMATMTMMTTTMYSLPVLYISSVAILVS
jgi:hypothetical protein